MHQNDLSLQLNNTWLHYIKQGMSSHVMLKCIGTTVFISLFFVAYFQVLNHPAYPATVIPFTFFDKLIDFQPLALPLYLSLWIYVVLPAAIITKLDELYAFTLSMTLMSIVSLSIFYFWPTIIPASEIDWALYPSIAFLKSVDAAGNACPSLHVATAFFSAAWSAHILRRINTPLWIRVLNILWCAGIIYATMATRQHVALDVLAGLVLGGITVGLVSRQFWRRA